MKDMTLKDIFHIGVGSMLMIKDKVEKELKDSDALKEDGEKIIKEKIKEVATEMGFATKEDIEELKRLIQEKNQS